MGSHSNGNIFPAWAASRWTPANSAARASAGAMKQYSVRGTVSMKTGFSALSFKAARNFISAVFRLPSNFLF